MTLEEIKNLDNSTLAIEIARCLGWEVTESVVIDGCYIEWPDCGNTTRSTIVCLSLDIISRIEKAVIKKTDLDTYAFWLVEIFNDAALHAEFASIPMSCSSLGRIATATARQRAEACLLALQDL